MGRSLPIMNNNVNDSRLGLQIITFRKTFKSAEFGLGSYYIAYINTMKSLNILFLCLVCFVQCLCVVWAVMDFINF